MSFPRVQTVSREINQIQSNIATAVNPFLNHPLMQGEFIKSVALINGTTVVNHLLNREPLGWFITNINAAATIYASGQSTRTITLVSNVAVTVDLYIF